MYLSDFARMIHKNASSGFAKRRTVAVGMDSGGRLYSSASNGGLDPGMETVSVMIGIEPIRGNPRNHAEENLVQAVPHIRSIGTFSLDPCSGQYAGHNCALLLHENNITVDNRPR